MSPVDILTSPFAVELLKLGAAVLQQKILQGDENPQETARLQLEVMRLAVDRAVGEGWQAAADKKFG